jgi:hypothetical protein
MSYRAQAHAVKAQERVMGRYGFVQPQQNKFFQLAELSLLSQTSHPTPNNNQMVVHGQLLTNANANKFYPTPTASFFHF